MSLDRFVGFLALSAIHQTSNYYSLTNLQLKTLNPQRISLLLSGYLDSPTSTVPSREAVAAQESFVWSDGEGAASWPAVGANLDQLCKYDPELLKKLRAASDGGKVGGEDYVLNAVEGGGEAGVGGRVAVGVMDGCGGQGLVRAMLHASLLGRKIAEGGKKTADHKEEDVLAMVADTKKDLERREAAFFEGCAREGWKIDDGSVAVEGNTGVRLRME